MAGDWIKIEKATARKPEVLRIADILNIAPDHAFALCVRFWMWCDDHMTNGHAPSVTNVTLDSVFGHAGFASALLEVGWLQARNGSLAIPNFDRHLSESAKNRALSGERKRQQRSRTQRDKSVTREEKRREESISPNGDIPPIVPERSNSDAFDRFWKAFPSGRKTKKGKARAAWLRAVRRTDPEAIVAAAVEYAASPKGNSRFVQGPEPWLNGECWNDDREAWQRGDDEDRNGSGRHVGVNLGAIELRE